MRYNITALKKTSEMHLFNNYNFKFNEVTQAFIKKY